MTCAKVYLVPGLYRFDDDGAESYFHRNVGDRLRRGLERRPCDFDVVQCPPPPAAGLHARAAHLRRHVEATGGLDADEIHFVAHATGGLDVRALLSPVLRVSENGDRDEAIARRARTLVTIATPHRGMPIADALCGRRGTELLRAWPKSLATGALRSRSVRASSMGAAWEPSRVALESLVRSPEACAQLSPAGASMLEAVVVDRETVAYSSVVASVPPPPTGVQLRDVVVPPLAARAMLFAALHRLAAPKRSRPLPPELPRAARAALERELPCSLARRASDGLVPACSQVHGRLLAVVTADHFDVVGRYRREGDPSSDWLRSGARFDGPGFEDLWDAVALEIGSARLRRRPRPRRARPGPSLGLRRWPRTTSTQSGSVLTPSVDRGEPRAAVLPLRPPPG